MELGRQPESGERVPLPDAQDELAARFTHLRDTFLGQLAARGPEQESGTWFPPDQAVGFWFRRMAHETAVHRVDAERVCGQETRWHRNRRRTVSMSLSVSSPTTLAPSPHGRRAPTARWP